MRTRRFRLLALAALVVSALWAGPTAAALTAAELAKLVMPPYRLGESVSHEGVWTIETSGGETAGYIFETEQLAPIPGFAGDPIDLLITIDLEGRFLDVTLLEHNEPIFVSGLGPGPLLAFLGQYPGRSLGDSITVGAPDVSPSARAGSAHAYVDGVTKATASVRIANETILAAAREVAREHLRGVVPRHASRPRQDHHEELDWEALVSEGIVRRYSLTNAELQATFAGTLWEHDDPEGEADLDGTYLDLVVVDVGPSSIASAVLAPETVAALDRTIGDHEEPILVLADGRHRLVDDDFVRHSVPDRLSAVQDELPIALRDADVETVLAPGVPSFAQAMILRVDTRLGFDPAAPWALIVRVVREHGSFMPEPGVRDLRVDYQAPPRFFETSAPANTSAWRAALDDRLPHIVLLIALLAPLLWWMSRHMERLASHPRFALIRIGILAATLVLIGWWAHGQLSIVTVLGVVRAAATGGSFSFLLYEPFLLVVWSVTLASLAVWGRGLFCGWLCPYGALQEFAHGLGRLVGLPQLRVHPRVDRRLKMVKYGVLAALVAATVLSAAVADVLVEVEPFKTAITLMFERSPLYVAYAVFWLVLGAFLFKGFCRWVCPLGAALALAGKVRRLDWVRRRSECGTPCQYCKASCAYGAIEPDGSIDYDECFQCLECVAILESPARCIPDRLARKKGRQLVPMRP